MSKILILDDSMDLLEMMKHVLDRKGYTVKILIRANDILREIKEFQPDLLILDIYLADFDGRELCKEIRKEIECPNLQILVFSASPKVLEDYKNYLADDFIEKPFDLKNLSEKITSVLNLKSHETGNRLYNFS